MCILRKETKIFKKLLNSPRKNIAVDIDGILTVETEGHNYKTRTPNKRMINKINQLFTKGHIIMLFTSRYLEDCEETKIWLHKNGVRYHFIKFDKLQYDLLIDDKSINTL